MKTSVRVILIAALLSIAGCYVAGCATTAKLNTDTVAQAGVAALVDVAVGEAIQRGGVSASALVEIATELKAFDTGQSVTIPALTQEIGVLVAKANLNPGEVAAVQILESTLTAVITQQLQAQSSAPAGVLSPTTVTTINIVLTDIITAAQIYSAQPVKPTTDIPPQNKHFVLASVEAPTVVGSAMSLVLVSSLQAFGHVSVGAPVAAAITVLFTAGAALIDNLVT